MTITNPTLRWLLLATALQLGGCAWLNDDLDITRDWSAQRLYSEAKGHMQQANYDLAVEYLEKLQARYPFGRFSQQAQLDLINIYYRNNQPDQALAAADRFVRTYPRNPFVDYAYFMRGVVNFNRGKMSLVQRVLPTDPTKTDTRVLKQAYNSFEELVTRFPDSRYAEDSYQRMVYLRNTLAAHELYVANFYLERKAFLAAANRASSVVKNYPQTSSVEGALSIMVEAYYSLDMVDLASDSLRILDLNFPNSPQLSRLEAMLKSNEPPSSRAEGGFFSLLAF